MKPLPNGWHQVSIQTFHKYYTLITSKWGDEIDLEVNLLACLRECSIADIEAMRMEDIKNDLISTAWLKEMPSGEIPVKFKCNGNTYKAAIIMEDQTAGQFMNFSQILNSVKPDEYIFHMQDLIGAMCTRYESGLFVEGGKVKWGRYRYDGYAKNAEELLEHLPMSKAYPFYLFFCEVIKRLSAPTQIFLIKELKKQIRSEKWARVKGRLKGLMSIGGGSR